MPNPPERGDPHALGAEGEDRAARFLAARGYRIDARNVRLDGVEVDLVARRGPLVVFVEVKTRSGRGHGGPAAAVDARKQARLVRAARAWLREHPGRAQRVRFDVVACVAVPGGRWQLEHWEGAFDADGS